MTGCLEFADPEVAPDNNCFTNALLSCEEHGLEHEVLSAEEVNARFPGYQLPPNFRVRGSDICSPCQTPCQQVVNASRIFCGGHQREPAERGLACAQALYQPQGGILASEKCISAHVDAALATGAELHTEERVLSWQVLPSGMVEVKTGKGAYQAVKLVLTAGAWMPQIVPQLQVLCSLLVSSSQICKPAARHLQGLHACHDMPVAHLNPCCRVFGRL
jgi:sarcosine oxidase